MRNDRDVDDLIAVMQDACHAALVAAGPRYSRNPTTGPGRRFVQGFGYGWGAGLIGEPVAAAIARIPTTFGADHVRGIRAGASAAQRFYDGASERSV